MIRRVVVTGASGFIGQAVVEELNRRRIPVLTVSRSGARGTQRVNTYRDTPVGEILLHLGEESRVDAIDVDKAREQEDVITVLMAAGFSRVVYASSATVYGDTSETARGPSDLTFADNPYLAGKLACEQHVLSAGGVAARLGNVYGTGMNSRTVVAEILLQLKSRGPLVIRDTSPVRDFLWIEDAARGLVDAALGVRGGIFNFGSGVGTSIADLAKLALKIFGTADRQLVTIATSDRVSNLVLNIDETYAAFGWRPNMSFEDGLKHLITA